MFFSLWLFIKLPGPGCEAWKLTSKLMASLRGWNARCLALITGSTVRDETVDPSFNLVGALRARRLLFLGKVLCSGENRVARRMLMEAQQPYPEGSIFMDAPSHTDVPDLAEQAGVVWEGQGLWDVYVEICKCDSGLCR